MRPTRVRAKFGGFHIPAHGYAKNAPGFRLKPSAGDISGRMQYAPTRVHEKFGGFHISAHGCAKNAPDFTFPNRDTPKTRPILDPNLRRGTFRGVCNTPLHVYVKNPAGLIFPQTTWCKTRPVLGANPCRRTFGGVCFCAPTRVRAKFGGFHISAHGYAQKSCPVLGANLRRGLFRGVCNTPLHVYVQNLAGFIFPHTT